MTDQQVKEAVEEKVRELAKLAETIWPVKIQGTYTITFEVRGRHAGWCFIGGIRAVS